MRSWAAWWGTRIGATGDSVTTPGTAATAVNARLHLLQLHDGSLSVAVAQNAIQLLVQWIRRGYVPRNTAGRGAGHDGLTPGAFGGFLPKPSGCGATAASGSFTSNVADGTAYWVITGSATAPDWDRIVAGQDHTGATVGGGRSGNQAVSTTGAQSISFSGVTLLSGNNYLHVVHKGAGTEAALDDYLRTSDTISSSAFTSDGVTVIPSLAIDRLIGPTGGSTRRQMAVQPHGRSFVRPFIRQEAA